MYCYVALASFLQGNVTGEDEYIIYNYYRAMPAYVLEYR